MCVVKTPKIQTPVGAADAAAGKPLQVLKNPLLDGIDSSIQSLRLGRNSLRIDPGSGKAPTGIQTPLNFQPQALQIGMGS